MSDVNISTSTTTRTSRSRLGSRWIDDWRPEDGEFWNSTGRAVARRNLIYSVFSEHIGFSIWSVSSVLVLFLGPEYGFDRLGSPLTAAPTLVGALFGCRTPSRSEGSAAATGRFRCATAASAVDYIAIVSSPVSDSTRC